MIARWRNLRATLQTFRKQRALPAIRALNEALHPNRAGNHGEDAGREGKAKRLGGLGVDAED
jgi:hypothetical protein